jgi:hypothetical protein
VKLKLLRNALAAALLLGCTTDVYRVVAPGMTSAEVNSRAGAPTVVGKLPSGELYWDYSRQPYYTERVTFGADERVRELRNLLDEENFRNLKTGMTTEQVIGTVGPSYIFNQYANGTTVWTYRFYDIGIAKLLHVTFDPAGRLLRYQVEWDPNVYSKKDRGAR